MKTRLAHIFHLILCFQMAFQPILAKAQTSTSSQTAAERLQSDVDSHQLSESEQEAQQRLMHIQLIWPLFKQLQNAAQSQIMKNSPSCWISKALNWMGNIALLSMMTRLFNMIINATQTASILDEMERRFFPENTTPAPATEKDFYEFLIHEYKEYVRFSEADFAADVMDLSFSSIEVILMVVEAIATKVGYCKANFAK